MATTSGDKVSTRLELGRPVHCSDGLAGELADVVVDPTRRRVTHLVVAPHHHHNLARLVPARLARADRGSSAIVLRCSMEELHRLPPVEEYAYLRLGDFPLRDPDWDVGIQTVLAQPYFDYQRFAGGPIDFDPHMAITYDRIPKGEVEIRRASDVMSSDGHLLGHVDGFLVDGDDGITHVVLERGHLFGRREVTVPIGAVSRVATDAITLTLTKDEVGRRPAVTVHRWTTHVARPGRREQAQGTPAAG